MSDPRDPARGYPGDSDRTGYADPHGPDGPHDLHEADRGEVEHPDHLEPFAHLEHPDHPGEPGYDVHEDMHDDLHADVYDDADDLEGLYADEEAEHTRSSRRADERAARRSRGRRIRGVVVLVVALAVVAGAGYVAVDRLRPLLSVSSASDDYPGPGTGEVTVTVKDGDTASAIGATLEAAGVVKTARAFGKAAAADPKGASIQPGSYVMRSQMTSADALAILVDPANRTGVPGVTIREGLWKSETFAALSKGTGTPVADYVAAAKDTASLGLPSSAKGNLEGYLFPATYEFPDGASAADQLRTMVAKSVEELTRLGVAPADMEKTVVIASIVQAEGQRAADLPKIARVIDNRLAKPMRLQLDSTVSYGVQKRAITTTDAERAAANGYNTYVRDGLPVGPISNPGAAAIQAATTPATGPWLYFVAVNPDTGETKFATTDAEHQKNVAEFQKWCSENKGKC